MRTLRLTDEEIQDEMARFKEFIVSSASRGRSKLCDYELRERGTASHCVPLQMSSLAYGKMKALVDIFDSEVAWHGAAERLEPMGYYISDIVVYPQTVTGTSVDIDEEEYGKWLMEIDQDERFSFGKIKMQGHSHVDMSTSPSSTDIQHQNTIVKQLGDHGFYIFMIANRSGEYTITIYDIDRNIRYDTEDVAFVVGDSHNVEDFIADAKKLVKSGRMAGRKGLTRLAATEEEGN